MTPSLLVVLRKKLDKEKKIAEILKLQLRNLERAKTLNEDLDVLRKKIEAE